MSANKNIVIGVTGGVATGKSTVVQLLRKDFKYLTSADEKAHQIVKPGKPAYKKIVKAFGREILAKDGTLDRKLLAKCIFASPAKRKRLQNITHPEIISEMKRDIARFKKRSTIVLFEAPLLFEAKMEKLADIIIVVASSVKNQLKRFAKKGHTKADTLRRIKSQIPLKTKIKKADMVIYNDGSLKELKNSVKNLAVILKEL
ncbi:MAG: dephospho-CoA kinase [Candidatus Firestonebacteria bacterium]|nr:dephospho-CoA kinase [Candidatus Firestonebacteria bacterium]